MWYFMIFKSLLKSVTVCHHMKCLIAVEDTEGFKWHAYSLHKLSWKHHYTMKPWWLKHSRLICYGWLELIPESLRACLYIIWPSVARTTPDQNKLAGYIVWSSYWVWLCKVLLKISSVRQSGKYSWYMFFFFFYFFFHSKIDKKNSSIYYNPAPAGMLGHSCILQYVLQWAKCYCIYSKIPILRPHLGLSKSGLEDHFWTVPKVGYRKWRKEKLKLCK